ncbi:hypothetical protein HMPREF1436_00462 [Helicobacter pylori GAMchJs136i]|nr:hypothetical protein HMPREF1436_00462 [Helicobacter pylori GAMchJs136i]
MPLTPPPINTQHKHKALQIAFLKLSSMTFLPFIKKFRLYYNQILMTKTF